MKSAIKKSEDARRKKSEDARRKKFVVMVAVAKLRNARNLLAWQGCKKAADKTRAALRSAEGALRNAARFAAKDRRAAPTAAQTLESRGQLVAHKLPTQ